MSASSTTSSSSASHSSASSTGPTPLVESPPALTRELLRSYQASHYRLLLWLGLMMSCVLAVFPINDPDIFFSLRTGQLISSGEFPWGSDPYCYAEGEQASWVHNGWLGDWIIYQVYQAGGGPALVLFRVALVAILCLLLMKLAGSQPRFLTVLVITLGFLALGQRLYLRTELFSIVLIGVTFWVLQHQPAADCRLRRLHALTAGRLYWLLPVVMLLWANLDGWFFLGLIIIAGGLMSTWLEAAKDNDGDQKRKSLLYATVLSVIATLVTPFHYHSFVEIPNRLMPATGQELFARWEEMKKTIPNVKMSEQLRFYASPVTAPFFDNVRAEQLATLNQAPFLGMFYPMGLSISEWAFYPLLVLLVVALLLGISTAGASRLLLLALFIGLGLWQHRLVGFFVAGGVTLAVLLFQSTTPGEPFLSRPAVLGKQLVCLLIGLVIQCCTLLHLVPSNDYATTSLGEAAIGYVHPRGAFGFAFRSDPSMEQACKTLERWQNEGKLAGKAFHYNWTDVVAYDTWFHPGSRHFFDRRYEVHDRNVAHDFLYASDALVSVLRETNDMNALYEQQDRWQDIFRKYDISHLIVKRRSVTRVMQGQMREVELVRQLLALRDRNNQPLWRPLQLHNGTIYVLAWLGSPHWQQLQGLEYNAEIEAFRQPRPPAAPVRVNTEEMTLSRYLAGDPPRRPAALDEAGWHLFFTSADSAAGVAQAYTSFDLQLRTVLGQLQARLATPLSAFPYFPVWLSGRQSSAAPILLSLEAIRRAVRELTPETTPYQRSEVWLQYLDTVTRLNDYEQFFLPVPSRLREAQMTFVLRQAALSSAEANRSNAWLVNLELAKVYFKKNLFDAALDHVNLARQQLENIQQSADLQNRDMVANLLKNLDAFCKQQFEFAPSELANQVKRQTEQWQQAVTQIPKSNEPGREAVARAGLALQLGLPRLAITELLASPVKSDEMALMATGVYSALGQHDLVLTEFFYRSPQLQNKLGQNFLEVAALGEWCLGRPEQAAEYRLKLAEALDRNNLETGIEFSLMSIFGTGTQPGGNVAQPIYNMQQNAAQSMNLADQLIFAGILYLEAGQPQKAVDLFQRVLRDIEPNTIWRLLLERYILQITGQAFKP